MKGLALAYCAQFGFLHRLPPVDQCVSKTDQRIEAQWYVHVSKCFGTLKMVTHRFKQAQEWCFKIQRQMIPKEEKTEVQISIDRLDRAQFEESTQTPPNPTTAFNRKHLRARQFTGMDGGKGVSWLFSLHPVIPYLGIRPSCVRRLLTKK